MARHITGLLLAFSPTLCVKHPAFQIQRVVHIFDPCLDFAVHVDDPQGLETKQIRIRTGRAGLRFFVRG